MSLRAPTVHGCQVWSLGGNRRVKSHNGGENGAVMKDQWLGGVSMKQGERIGAGCDCWLVLTGAQQMGLAVMPPQHTSKACQRHLCVDINTHVCAHSQIFTHTQTHTYTYV